MICTGTHCFNSNYNSTFIALNLYLLTDYKMHNARNQRSVNTRISPETVFGQFRILHLSLMKQFFFFKKINHYITSC